MLAACVLDCSVAMSWFLPDESSNVDLLNHIVKNGAIVPALWTIEVGNVLLVSHRNKRITSEQCHQALYALKELPIIIDSMTSQNAWLETMTLAERYELTLYDACYLELSLRLSLPLATFDKALKKAAEKAGVVSWQS